MGIYTGRTQSGRVFPVLREYFNNAMTVGCIFEIGGVTDVLIERYNEMNSARPINTPTSIQDGIRAAALPGGFLQKIDHGKYKLLRTVNPKKDAVWFQQNYYKKAAKGVKYRRMKKDNTNTLTQLGSQNTKYVYDSPSKEMLETFENKFPHRDYITEFIFKEFSSLCPKTGQPDFAEITVHYIPDTLCIETKSLKLYFLAYRQHGAFMETITNQILEDCVAVAKPRYMKITSHFNARGGTLINVEAEYEAD